MKTDRYFQQIEKDLLKNNKLLRLNGNFNKILLGQKLSLETFLINLFKLNEKYNTFQKGERVVFCLKNKRRSTQDIFLLTKYYRPNVSFKKVCKALGSLTKKYLYTCLCDDIKRRTWSYMHNINYAEFDDTDYVLNSKHKTYDFGLLKNDYI